MLVLQLKLYNWWSAITPTFQKHSLSIHSDCSSWFLFSVHLTLGFINCCVQGDPYTLFGARWTMLIDDAHRNRETGIKKILKNKFKRKLQITAPFHCQHVYRHMLEDPESLSGSLHATASLQSSCYQEAWAAHWTWESLLWSNLVEEYHPAPQKLRSCHKHGILRGWKAVCNTSKISGQYWSIL